MKRLPQGKFKIGFWNYGNFRDPVYSNVKDWVECGMTLPMSPGCGPEDKEKIIQLLKECEKAGIGLILCDWRINYNSFLESGEDKFREAIKDIYADYGKYPALNSVHLGDEPTEPEQFEALKKAVKIVKEEMPDVRPYINFISISFGHFSHRFNSYEELRDELKEIGVDRIAYDCYCQMEPNGIWDDIYFDNLNYFSRMSGELGVPLAPSALSVGIGNYKCPKEDDFRFQLNTAVAYGCSELYWFFFYMRRPHSNYRLSPIDEHGERTETYHWLSRILRTFHKTYGDLFDHLKLIEVTHAGDVIGNTKHFTGNEYIQSVSPKTVRSTTVSLFEDARNGKKYLAVVNNSQRESTIINITAKGEKVKSLKLVIWNEERETMLTCPESGTADWADWFAPGQMNLFEIEER